MLATSTGAGCTGITLRRVKVRNGHSHGIRATASNASIPLELTIDDCDVTDNNFHGILAELYDDLRIVNSRSLRNGVAGKPGSGIVHDGGVKATITGNTCSDNYVHGISSSNRATTDSTINTNTCERNGLVGLFGWGIVCSWLSLGPVVTSNRCVGNYNGGITVDPQVTPASTVALAVKGVVANNVCKDSVAATGIGINANWVKFLAITGNTCSGNPLQGISVIGRECSISGNVLTDNGAYGLRLSWPATATEDHGLHNVGDNTYSGNAVGDILEDAQLVGVRYALSGLEGSSVLVGGTTTVAAAEVTANSRIILTSQVDGGTVGFLRVSARTPGTSFVITSSSGDDTSTVAWVILEPA